MIKNRECKVDLTLYPKDFSPAHKRILSSRQIEPDCIQKPLNKMLRISSLLGATQAAELIAKHLDLNSPIVIVGDYDADGATATAVLAKVLQSVSDQIQIFIPNRIEMGYGLSSLAVDAVLKLKPSLVITVDNGITAVEPIQKLRDQNIDVIVTDHHLPAKQLPFANVIVNPNQPACSFKSKSIAGVGVAFYVALALRQLFKSQNNPAFEAFDFMALLEYVAIGTVADVVTLDYNNRILVEQGLKRIRSGKIMPGIRALIEISNVNPNLINSTDIAFQIAPKINAAGRISDMTLGVDCLLTTSDRLACDYATALTELNHERKSVENEMNYEAENIISSLSFDASLPVICLYNEFWHEGVIGIIASRIKQKYNKPTIIFTKSGATLKGSARSIEGLSIIAILNQVHSSDASIISNFGGHKMAAGLSLAPDRFDLFKDRLNQAAEKVLAQMTVDSAIYTDGGLLTNELSIENAKFLKTFEVWGSGVPEPLFNNTFYLDRIRLVGKNHAKMVLLEQQSGKVLDAIAFDRYEQYSSLRQSAYNMVYRLTLNTWQGKKSLSLLIEHIEV